jgi:hypothetical protein
MPIYAVKKYLATKLGLSSESQVKLHFLSQILQQQD